MTDYFDDLLNDNELNGKKASTDTFISAAREMEQEKDMSWNYWRLCEELTIVQVTLLIIGLDPSEYPYVMNWDLHERPENFSATYSALSNAVTRGRLEAHCFTLTEREWDKTTEQYYDVHTGNMDWEQTTISVESIKDWLRERQLRPAFFFPPSSQLAFQSLGNNNIGFSSYLNKSHPNFSLKLKAAINAWEAITNAPPIKVSPKTAIVNWLRKNAEQYGLIKDDGTLNETGIEEIAKVAHWRTKGGALKTLNNSSQDVLCEDQNLPEPPIF